MADFCKQCSEATFGKDFEDLAGLCTREENRKNLYSSTLCEGCGPIQVNYLGECVNAESCLCATEKRFGPPHEQGKLFHKLEIKRE